MKTERPLMAQSYTSQQLDEMEKTWDKASFAMALDSRVRAIEKQNKLTYVELGIICLRVEQKELYLSMYDGKFKSFGAWITDAAPYSRATAYSALGEVKRLIEDNVPLDVANKLPRCNLKTVNRLSTSLKRDPEILKAAEVLEEQEFKRKIRKEHPEQHIEDDSPMRLKFERSQRVKVDEAIDVAMAIYELPTREAAIEVICTEFLSSTQTQADYEEAEKAMAAYA